ncbi:MAG: transglutaminase domain-containing protein [Candidatus Altiarchaeota archaeon]|nr:transglutaminase domain-containing protein [Candidatus Altiarchaeota archaeon]
MRLLVLSLLLLPIYSVVIGGDFQVQVDFSVYGSGNGEIEVLEYPGNFAGQTGTCTDTKLNFPPSSLSMICDVSTFSDQSLEFASYDLSELTVSDSTINELANSLVEGKETRFDEAIALAGWIRENVEYDLGVGDTQETGKWAYYNKIGTCDELSHLFITMARAVGLDARYSAGYAYDGQIWLPHAWAEVWTRYGWTPIDVAFDEYGYVDGQHISVNKGPDGDHNFIAIYYFGDAIVNHSFDISTKNLKETDFVLGATSLNTSGGAYTLVEVSVKNPFDTPIAFFPKFLPPPDFAMEFVYPTTPLTVLPGISTKYLVYKIPQVRQNYFYSIPLSTYLGPELVETSFTVSDNFECKPLRETKPYTYDTSKCFDLNLGEIANKTSTNGDFFCDLCYFHLDAPNSRSYQLDYPEFCEENCSIKIGVIGGGPYSISVNSNNYIGLSSVYTEVTASLNVGANVVVVDGISRIIEVTAPPTFELSEKIDGGEVCLTSNWQLDANCVSLSCGENSLNLKATYDTIEKSKTLQITRSCNFIERLFDFFKNLTS